MPTIDFDLNDYELKTNSFEPLPKGVYTAAVVDSGMCVTKAGNGEYIKLEMNILEGEHTGRRIWENLNVYNANPKAEEIARGNLRALFRACNKPNERATENIHDVPFKLILDIDRRDPTRNKVIGYAPIAGTVKTVYEDKVEKPQSSARKPWEK